jgi:glycosyltransferase involved in cell wall biosynthesis
VDQDPNGGAAAICAEFASRGVRYMRHSQGGKSAALNAGIAAATGDYVAFTDDDCTVPPGWLTQGYASLSADSTLGIVFGGARPAPHKSGAEFVPWFVPPHREVRSGRTAIARIGALGGNMFCRRSLLEVLGGFDELLGPGTALSSAEDQDLNNRALRRGSHILADPSLLVTHWGNRPYADGDVARLLRGYSVGIGALAMKDLRCRAIAGAYPLMRELAAEVRSAFLKLLGRNREPFVLRSPWLVAGLFRGARLGIDTRQRFKPRVVRKH